MMLRLGIGHSAVWQMMLILVAVGDGSTQAAVTVYSNQVDYDAAVGTELFFIDFNGSSGMLADGDSFSSEVTFGSPEATDPTKVLWNSDAITDAGSTSAPNAVGPIDGVFAAPVAAFALVFSSSGEKEEISLFAEDTGLIDTVTAPNASGFFGVHSDTPIKTFLLDNGTFPNGSPDRFFVDDFRANVPEPSSGVTIGIGAVAMLLFGRRLNRHRTQRA
jgi:hypothetical protein